MMASEYQKSQLAPVRAELEAILPLDGSSFRMSLDDFPCERARWNYHPQHEIHLITSSSGIAFIGDHVGSFGPGYLAFVSSMVPHNWVTPHIEETIVPQRDLVLQFSPDLLRRAAQLFPEMDRYPAVEDVFSRSWEYTGAAAEEGAALLWEIRATANRFERLARFFRLLALLATTSERHQVAHLTSPTEKTARHSAMMQKLTAMLAEQLSDDISLGDVAKSMGMSASTFSRFFRRHMGRNFVDYLRLLRIRQACRLLVATEEAITGIALSVGYRNISNFNRSFLRETGLSPRSYRSQARSGAREGR